MRTYVNKKFSSIGQIMIGARIREYRKGKQLTLAKFATLVGISHGSLSDIENEKTKPSADTITAIVRNTDIDPTWLLTGEGPVRKEEGEPPSPISTPFVASPESEINIHELLNMTAQVLASDTIYKPALAANIRAFSEAIGTQKANQEMRQRITQLENDRAKIENRMASLEARLAAAESAARAAPEGKAEEMKKTAAG